MLLALAAVASCTDTRDAVAPPVAAGLDAEDRELAAFLADHVDRATADPGSAEARGRLAMAYDANGFVAAAIESYHQALWLDSTNFLWPYLRALLLADRGDYTDALGDLDHALASDDGYASTWLWQGMWLMDLGRVEEAAVAFRQAAQRASGESARAAAQAGLARVHLAQGNTAQARRLLTELAADTPHPFILRLLTRARRALGDDDAPPAAAPDEVPPLEWADPRRAQLQDYVRGFDGRLRQAEDLLNRGDAEAALAMLEPLRERRPTDRTLLNNLAIAYATTGRPATAMETLQAGLREHDGYYLLHFNAAAAYEERGDLRAALAHLERTLALQSGFAPAYARKVELLIATQRHDEALAAVDAAADQGAANPELLYRAGVIEGANGRWGKAIDRFRAAAGLAPSFARAHLALGRSLGEAGRLDEAREALAEAERLGVSAADLAGARRRIDALAGSSP